MSRKKVRSLERVPGQGAAIEGEVVEAEPAEGEPLEPTDDELADVDLSSEPPTTLARRRETSLGPRDPLAAYMAEVTQHPVLSREDELVLAQRYRATGDVKAAYRLVASNLRLVVKLAHEYHRRPLALLDLIQEGNIGLMQAVRKFDPERGVKLSSYAAWWIRAYILRYIMDNWKMVKIGTTEAQRKLFFKLRQEQERLAVQGFEVTPKLLAERLSVSEQDVVEMNQRLSQNELSLEAPIQEGEKRTQADQLLTSTATSVDEALGTEQLKALVKEKLDTFAESFNDKERYIYTHRLMSDEPLTLNDIGAHFGVSRERARQLEAALIERIRAHMRAQIPDFDMVARVEEG